MCSDKAKIPNLPLKMLDHAIYFLTFFITFLLTTGGIRYSSPRLKLELSQVDAFAWVLLILLGIRAWRTGAALPRRLQQWVELALRSADNRPLQVLGAAALSYIIVFTWNAAWRFDSFHANAFDLGYVDQALWSTTRVGFLHSSLSKGQTYLGEHFSPVLALPALLYRLWDSVYLLFFFQSTLLASGGLLAYALARNRGLNQGISVLVAVCFFAYQPLRLANNFDFREDNFFVPVFLSMLLALDQRKLGWVWAMALASWTIKENAPLFTFLTGLWLIFDRSLAPQRSRRPWHGLALAALSLVAFAVINTKVTPYFAGAGTETMAARRLRHLGNSNSEILANIIARPLVVTTELTRPLMQAKAAKYAASVLLPFLPFAAAAPFAMLIALAGVLMNLMVNQPTIGFHYECILLPFLFYVLVSGLSRWAARRTQPALGPQHAFLVLLSFLLFFGRSPADSIRQHMPDSRDRWLAEELAKVPQSASVATQSVIHPHLTHRKDAFLFSKEAPRTDYIIVDLALRHDRYGTPNLENDAAAIDTTAYELLTDHDGLKIWRRQK